MGKPTNLQHPPTITDFTSVYNDGQRRVETFALGSDGFLYNLCWKKEGEERWEPFWRRLPELPQ